MTPEQLTQLLDELGQRLGPAGTRVFELAVRQVYIDAIISVVFALVLAGGAIWGIRRVWAIKFDEDDRGPARTLAVATTIVALLFAAWVLSYNLGRVFNPEYAALRDLLFAITGKT